MCPDGTGVSPHSVNCDCVVSDVERPQFHTLFHSKVFFLCWPLAPKTGGEGWIGGMSMMSMFIFHIFYFQIRTVLRTTVDKATKWTECILENDLRMYWIYFQAITPSAIQSFLVLLEAAAVISNLWLSDSIWLIRYSGDVILCFAHGWMDPMEFIYFFLLQTSFFRNKKDWQSQLVIKHKLDYTLLGIVER